MQGDSPRQSQFALLRQRRFLPFFCTQLLGALNDNVFKIAFTSLVTYHTSRFEGVDGTTAAFLISAIFILPFVLFSATSGQIADKYDRAQLMRWVKRMEVAIMLVGALGFWYYSAPLLYLATFLMGLHSTLFGPAKYAYLPQHLKANELVGGNGLVQMATFVAILIGTIGGGELARQAADEAWWIGVVCLVLAGLGLLAAARVPPSPAPAPDLPVNWNPFTETARNLKLAGQDRTVFMGMLGISWLWFLGATFLASFFAFSRDVLFADQSVLTLLLTMFSLGIGAGALLCERLSGGRLELGLVPLGALGMTAFAVDLYLSSAALPILGYLQTLPQFLAQPTHWRILLDLWLLSLFAGIYSVPLYALIQSRSDPAYRARIIAANNILNALFMVLSAIMAMGLLAAGLNIPQLYGIAAVLNILMAAILFLSVPEFMSRFVRWSRLRRINQENVND